MLSLTIAVVSMLSGQRSFSMMCEVVIVSVKGISMMVSIGKH